MLSKMIKLVNTFITIIIIMGVKSPEPVEAWEFCWLLSSEEWKDIQKRDKAIRRINDKRDADLTRLIINTEVHERLRREQEREQRRKAFMEWKDNCDRIFRPLAS